MLVPVWLALQSLAAGETCPAPDVVLARVRSILHLAPEQQLSESFLVERHEAGLYVVLKSADSSVIGERTLPLEGSCDELAQAAAVVLSAWLTHVHPDFAGALPTPTTEAVPSTVEPEKPPQAQPMPEPVPKPSPVAVTKPPAATPEPAANSARLDWGLGGGGDLTGDALAPAGLLTFGYGPERFGFGLTALAVFTTSRDEPLGSGNVSWRRWPLGAGLNLRLSSPSLRWDVGAGPTVAWLHLTGENFDDDYAQDGATWGGFLGLRISGRDRLAPFGLLNLQIYPGDSVAQVLVSGEEWRLPMATFLVTVGMRLSH